MPESQLQMSPGTESILRAKFAKGFYYNDNESLVNCAETLSQFVQNETICQKIDDFRSSMVELDSIKEKLRLARAGEIYVELWQQHELNNREIALKVKLGMLKKDLINFTVAQMEKKELMTKTFTILTLKKLPLTLRGSRAAGPEEEVEAEEYYDEEY